jgi:Flp pilus assembly protein TadD
MKNQARSELLENKLNEMAQATAEQLYATATELARKGKYLQAEKALSLLSAKARPSAKTPLLLGKIYAQQHRYEDAIQEWQKALKIEPNNEASLAAIKRAELIMQHKNSKDVSTEKTVK